MRRVQTQRHARELLKFQSPRASGVGLWENGTECCYQIVSGTLVNKLVIKMLSNVVFREAESQYPEITEGCATPHVEVNQRPRYTTSLKSVETGQ